MFLLLTRNSVRLSYRLGGNELHNHHRQVQGSSVPCQPLLCSFQGIGMPFRWSVEWRDQWLCFHHVQLHQPLWKVPTWALCQRMPWRQGRVGLSCDSPGVGGWQCKCRFHESNPRLPPHTPYLCNGSGVSAAYLRNREEVMFLDVAALHSLLFRCYHLPFFRQDSSSHINSLTGHGWFFKSTNYSMEITKFFFIKCVGYQNLKIYWKVKIDILYF